MRQIGWYWMPQKNLPHFVKNVTLSFYDDAEQTHTYINQGPMVMDNYGQLTKVSV